MALAPALKKILRPLIRLLIHFQVSFPQLSEIIKSVYVEVAERDFTMQGHKQTDSRISLVTGVHRKDVRRLRNMTEVSPDISNPAVGAKLVSAWLENKPFCEKKGSPSVLYIRERYGSPAFDQLVTQVSKQDLRPKAVLEEWLLVGIVELVGDRQIKLCSDAYIPQQSTEEKCYFFGRNIADHLASSVHNLSSDEAPFFDRHVFYNHLSPDSISELAELTSKEGMSVLKLLNRKAKQLQVKDRGKSEATHRFNVGIFYYEVDEDDQ